MKILIDADACPKTVLQICCALGQKYDVAVWTIASFNHIIHSDHHIVADNDSQAADIKVMNLSEAGDIVVTQDWGLAAMVLGKKARCLSPTGREYQAGTMDFLLEERNIKAQIRRSGGRTRGPRKRSNEDDKRFVMTLEKILTKQHIAENKS